MSKIPVGDTISFAYSFVFGRFLTLLRLSWIPLAIMTLPSIFTSMSLSTVSPTSPPHEYRQAALLIVVGIVQFVCVAMIVVAYTECALGLSHGRRFTYLPSARLLGKLIVSWVIAFLTLLPVLILFFVFMFVLQRALGTSSGMEGPGAGFVVTLAAFVGMGVVLYVWVRLTFLLTPTVVAEGKINLRRSWDLTRGNFWRCMAIGISIMAPFVVAAWVLLFIFSKFVGAFPPALEAAQTAAQRQQALEAWQAEYVERMRALWPLLSAASIAFYVFMYGIAVGASAFAYRALVPVESSGEGDA